MSIAPIDYSTNVKTPFESAIQGFSAGSQMQDVLQKQQVQQNAINRQYLMQGALSQLAAIPNPTAQDINKVTMAFPEVGDEIRKSYGALSQERQQSLMGQLSQIHAAALNGKNQTAYDLTNQIAQSYRNAGDNDTANLLDTTAKNIQEDPGHATIATGLALSSIMGPDKYAATYGGLGKEQRDNQMQPIAMAQGVANVNKTNADTGQVNAQTGLTKAQTVTANAQASAAPQTVALQNAKTQEEINKSIADRQVQRGHLDLDWTKANQDAQIKMAELQQKMGTLSDGQQTFVTNNVTGSATSQQAANQQLDLADRLDKAGGGYGAASTAAEWLKGATGNQDSMTQLRNEYARIKNSQALKMLPPGPASDKDVAMATKGFPSETADSKTMASFLRGMAKLNQRDAAYQEMQAEWMAANAGLGSAKRDINVLGVSVPAKTTFNDFAAKNIGTVLSHQATKQVQAQISSGQRSYMQYAQ